ncbi:hypothetical protein, partial [Klebsiella pneumoniae]
LVVAADSATPSPVIAGPLGLVMWGVFAVVIAVLALYGQLPADRLDARLGPDPVVAPAPTVA